MSWTEAKTNWVATDHFNISDFNRIKNNIQYIYEASKLIWGDYDITAMGADMDDYTEFWDVSKFNAFENNLDTINAHMLNVDIGVKQTFYENGLFIGYEELNRLESATVLLKATIDGWYEAMAQLPFRLGGRKAFKA